MSTEAQTRPDFWTRLGHAIGRLFAILLRLLFVLLLAAGIGAGVYYGVPYAYATLVQPVQANANQIVVVSSRVDNLKTSIDASQAAQDKRLTALETGSDSQRQRLDALESDLATAKSSLGAEQSAGVILSWQRDDNSPGGQPYESGRRHPTLRTVSGAPVSRAADGRRLPE